MKKLKSSLAAKVVASLLLVVLAVGMLYSVLGIGIMYEKGAYSGAGLAQVQERYLKPWCVSNMYNLMESYRNGELLENLDDIAGMGFAIYDERVIYDGGRYYQILCAAKGKEQVVLDYYPNDFLLVGQMAAVNSPDMLMRYLRHRLHGTKKRLVSANSKKNPPTELIRQAQEIENVISILEERL